MKALTARLMRMQRYSVDQVLRLHKAEAAAEKRFQAFMANQKASGSSPLDYFSAGNIFMMRLDSDLGNFWDAQKTESEKGVEVERFERSILTVCRRHGVNDLNDTPEMSVMHRLDEEVLRSAYKVNTARGLNSAGRLSAFIGEGQ